ncbi:four helix bundle protein [Candidatus Microgenomates bacterium]|nr:four helix bundle protein [Candidatus Microgenomates bacterium]
MRKTSAEIGQELAEKTMKELGLGKYGNVREANGKTPLSPLKLPFRIPIIEKTTRQAQSTQGYKASAAWQTAMLLHDLITLWTTTLPIKDRRKREQLESAIWSVVSTIEEGWARPTTKEYLDFIGFSQASLAEVRGGIERFADKELLRTVGKYGKLQENTGTRIPTPSRNSPYPPVNSRRKPMGIYEKLREFTGKDIKPSDLTYEIFLELVNKTDYLLKRTVEGLQNKIIREEKQKLAQDLERIRQKNW